MCFALFINGIPSVKQNAVAPRNQLPAAATLIFTCPRAGRRKRSARPRYRPSGSLRDTGRNPRSRARRCSCGIRWHAGEIRNHGPCHTRKAACVHPAFHPPPRWPVSWPADSPPARDRDAAQQWSPRNSPAPGGSSRWADLSCQSSSARCLWEPSQKGGFLVRLQVQK